ncbi:MAG: hypothetical protein H0U47_00640 [Nocardioidaceae bacterium]|nr:hypothetical protein [Nocardioidaceae bacterium]
MGLFDSLLGRSRPAKADLDALFGITQAAFTLEAAIGLRPTGVGAVCYRANEGAAFATAEADLQQLLDADGGPAVETSHDSYGFTSLVCRQPADALSDLVTELHAVNQTLENNGFGPSLLCSVVGFVAPDGRQVGVVYLYKRGTFYPFAPVPGAERRDNAMELQVRGAVGTDLRIEPELHRWLALWGTPALA